MLRSLSEAVGGWFYWSRTVDAETFVALDEWRPMHAGWLKRFSPL